MKRKQAHAATLQGTQKVVCLSRCLKYKIKEAAVTVRPAVTLDGVFYSGVPLTVTDAKAGNLI